MVILGLCLGVTLLLFPLKNSQAKEGVDKDQLISNVILRCAGILLILFALWFR
jgi:hypothetical protein